GLPEVVAVRDRTGGLIEEESADWGIPQEEYFNAGMFFLSRPHHSAWLRLAESLRFERPTPLYDQSPMNAARVRLKVPLRLLDRRHNWVGYGGSTLSHKMPVAMAPRPVTG